MRQLLIKLFLVAAFSHAAKGVWRNMAPGQAVWTDNGNSWTVTIPDKNSKWHYGPARIWTTPINSDHYEITSTVRQTGGVVLCGHVFKYKKDSKRTEQYVTKTWGYFLHNKKHMYITSFRKEGTPRIDFKYNLNQWYKLRSVVKGALVKIYIDGKLVKRVTMVGDGATAKKDNYVGIWCHGGTATKGRDFNIKTLEVSSNRKLACASNHMLATIPKSSLPHMNVSDLRLNNPVCGATEDNNNFYLKTDLDKCGTKVTTTPTHIIYTNKVLGKPLAKNAVISRIRDIEISLSCTYLRKRLLSSLNIQPNNTKFVSSFTASGKFEFDIKLFPTDKFQTPYKKYPVSLHIRQLVFVQLTVKSLRKELSILAQECYASPASNGNPPRHSLIANSCPADPTLKLLQSGAKNVQRFSVQTFRFIGNHKYVYFHCHVITCDGSNANSVCVKGCSQQKVGKREESNVESFKVTGGPVAVREPQLDEDLEQLDNQLDDPRSLPSSEI